jgi:hypothetical protein
MSAKATLTLAIVVSASAGCVAEISDDPDRVAATAASLEQDEFCLEGIDASALSGPYDYDYDSYGSVNLYVPDVPSECRVPVVHVANGTGATCSMYNDLLGSLASHGFLAVCYEDTNTGAGDQGLEAIEIARELYPDMVSDKIGSAGHSQGGMAAFTVLANAEDTFGPSFTYAGLAMQPASGFGSTPWGGWRPRYASIDSPMFMFSGSNDILVSGSWVQDAFDALSDDVEAYYWEKIGSTHIPVPARDAAEVGIPWFRWKLLDDQDACEDFYALRGPFNWTVEDEQNAVPCGAAPGDIGGDDGGDDDGGGLDWWNWWLR